MLSISERNGVMFQSLPSHRKLILSHGGQAFVMTPHLSIHSFVTVQKTTAHVT